MKIDEHILEKIDLFISGQMREEEAAKFKVLIEENDALKEAVSLSKEIDLSISDPVGLNIEDQLKELGDKHGKSFLKEAKSNKSLNKSTIIKWTLLAIALLIIGYLLNQNTSQTSNLGESLYAMHYNPYETSNQIRSVDSSDIKGDDISTLYQRAKFEEVILLANDNITASVEIDKSLFLKSMSQIELGQLDSAKAGLKSIGERIESPYQQQSLWYLALLQLKEEDIDLAKITLEQVKDLSTRGKYKTQAEELLKTFY